MTKRSVATVIILTLVTCGIYGWYWMYTTSNELQKESGQSQLSPMAILLLSIFLGTVGYALFGYDSAKCIDSLNPRSVHTDRSHRNCPERNQQGVTGPEKEQ